METYPSKKRTTILVQRTLNNPKVTWETKSCSVVQDQDLHTPGAQAGEMFR